MGSADPGQENFEAYRYQLSAMAYAAGLAHYHRLPALRSVFRALFEQLIHKMMQRHVWGYWYMTSQSGKSVDPDITELRKPFPDPVCRENIMYSGHLLLMVSLHGMLFDSDRYDEPGALTFDWDPMFFGMGPEKFSYTRTSLQKAILDDMERTGWMGVCCEPNCVFIICNQFPLIAVRYNDVRNGTDVIAGVLEKYQAAWKEKNGGFTRPGFTGEDGLVFFYMVKQDSFVPSLGAVAANAWASAFMNSWNSDFVHEWYPKLIRGYLTRFPDGRVNLNSQSVVREIRAALDSGEEADDGQGLTVSPKMVARAAAKVQKGLEEKKVQSPMGPGTSVSDFGYTMQWASEVAPPPSSDGVDVVAGLLKHADTYLNPSWENGGLYYPRRDGPSRDADGNWIGMEPYSGNAGIAYGRLNVRDGQKKMWENPWTREGHHAKYPYVEGVELSSGVDFLRGEWNEDLGAMVLTMRTWDGRKRRVDLQVKNLPAGVYGLYQSSQLALVIEVKAGDVVNVEDEVGGDEVDIVILRHQ
ncbi:Linalool dehydratase/isomerase [Cytospora mali]|uniref:Linalool dehydratase/isomerase n=1 Tax=Cytospora mali TaxID=578113 RepID=A0A194W1J7_CYTMA|nr:Linalool dehydratase/isomerase [Valsa mali]